MQYDNKATLPNTLAIIEMATKENKHKLDGVGPVANRPLTN